jgi:hypothetical protein
MSLVISLWEALKISFLVCIVKWIDQIGMLIYSNEIHFTRNLSFIYAHFHVQLESLIEHDIFRWTLSAPRQAVGKPNPPPRHAGGHPQKSVGCCSQFYESSEDYKMACSEAMGLNTIKSNSTNLPDYLTITTSITVRDDSPQHCNGTKHPP